MSKLKYYDGTNWKVVNGQITGDTLPIGAIVPYGSATAPTNWLVCDGSAVSRTTYSELFAIIGTSFGSGDGSTTFNLPNLKKRTPIGQDTSDTDFDTIGETGGSKTHTQTTDEVAPHTHQLWVESDQSGSAYGLSQTAMYWEKATNNWANGQFGVNRTNVNTPQPMNIMNPYQVVCYIIKAKQSAGVVANVSNTQSDSTTDTYSCDYINNRITGTELWINTSLGAAFGPQTIQVDLSPYKYIELVYYRYPSTTTPMFRIFTKVGDISQLNYCDYDSGSVRAWIREFEVKSTGIEFKIATINGTTDNGGLVPGKIIGHK